MAVYAYYYLLLVLFYFPELDFGYYFALIVIDNRHAVDPLFPLFHIYRGMCYMQSTLPII